MADKLYGLTADQVRRIERVLRSVEAGTMRGVPNRPTGMASRTKLGYVSYADIAPGGSGPFDWRQSTAAGTTEVLITANAVTAYDWFGAGASTGDKVLLFRPEPSARWYFMKPGGNSATANWGKVSVGPSTKVTAGFGSTQTDWIAINPADAAVPTAVDTGTTYVVELPEVAFDSGPYLTTGDVIAYMTAGSARVPVSQYATPHAYFQYKVAGKTHTFSTPKNCIMFTTVAGTTRTTTLWGLQANFAIDGNGTTSVYFVPKQAGAYELSYIIHMELVSATSRTAGITSFMSPSTGPTYSAISHTQSYISDWLYPTTADARNTFLTHSQSCIASLTTSNKVCVVLETPSYTDVVRYTATFSGHLVDPLTNSHFWTSGITAE